MIMNVFNNLYRDYGEYNILFNQLNMPSPSVEYAWRKTKKILQDETLKIIHETNNELRIGDIGCGNGALLIRLAEMTHDLTNKIAYQGYDISQPFIDYGLKAAQYKNLSNISFTRFDIESSDIPHQYDVIICSEVLEHLHEPKRILDKLYRALNTNGILLLTTPNAKNLVKYPFLFLKKFVRRENLRELAVSLPKKEQQYKLAELEQHINVFSFGELNKLLIKMGFTVYKTPRSTTLFGGPFLDNHPMLLGFTMITDSFLDFLPFPQIGWDNIFFCRR